ncbi:DUF7121 family protein, partial [Halococcus hamelinensis]
MEARALEHHNEMISAYREADDVRDDADEWHEKFVDLLDEHAKDEAHGGYVEYFTPEWEPILDGR